MSWSKTVPVPTSRVLALPTIFQDNWWAMAYTLSKEHYSMINTLSGRHVPGYTGVVHVSGGTEIAALSSPQTGALAFDTSAGSGHGLYRSGTGWVSIHYNLPSTRVVVAVADAGVTLAAGVSGIPLSASPTEVIDTLGEFDTSTGVFSAKAAGYFLVSTTMCVCAADKVAVAFSGSDGWYTKHESDTAAVRSYISISHSIQADLASGDTIATRIKRTGSGAVNVSGGIGVSYMSVWRIS